MKADRLASPLFPFRENCCVYQSGIAPPNTPVELRSSGAARGYNRASSAPTGCSAALPTPGFHSTAGGRGKNAPARLSRIPKTVRLAMTIAHARCGCRCHVVTSREKASV